MEKIKQFIKKVEKMFQDGTKEQFHLHEFLLISNLLLTFIMIYEFYAKFNNYFFPPILNKIELFFGVIFLIELILYIIFVYIPNKVYFKPVLWLNAFVTISLLFPSLVGNLALLRLFRTTSILKLYQYNKKIKEEKRYEMYSIRIIKTTYSILIKRK